MSETLLFGLTMLVVGMGGTLLTLIVIALILRARTMIFPVERPGNRKEESLS